jgi:hypothetical protein
MIRAYDDSWSRKQAQAHYRSPIGKYLHEYGKHTRVDAGVQFKIVDTEDPKHKLLADSRKVIQSLIKKIAKSDADLNFPEYPKIFRSKNLQVTLLHAEFPSFVVDFLTESQDSQYSELLRLVLFANFVLDRIALTIVTARNEDYAFDMFESLNTTGEPLTAFETFKPKVIAAEGLDSFEYSESYASIEAIEKYLESFGKSDEKQEATSKLIVSFALAESGEKLSKRLSDQRRYLRDRYDKSLLDSRTYQRSFARHLAHTATFTKELWPDSKKAHPDLSSVNGQHDDIALLCIDFLRQFGHTITIPPLVRFYAACRMAQSEERPSASSNFLSALKALTAFSVLWRSSRTTTDGIDNWYRKLMSDGYPAAGLPPMCRFLGDETRNSADVESLKLALVGILKSEGGISDKSTWVSCASGLPLYSINLHLTRFLLIAASHDSIPDSSDAGLLIRGRRGILPLMSLEKWRDEVLKTVEHIAPESRSQGWNENIYEDPDLIHRLGNLTLLPGPENSSLSNGPWIRKRFFYKTLAASTIDEADALLAQARSQEININQTSETLLSQSRYLPLVKSISMVDGEWTKTLIEKRSVRIAELAWDNLFPLLSQ